MKKTIIILLIITFINFIYFTNGSEPVELIVNLTNNNSYIKGGECGNLTLTCNSINDAIEYFRNISEIIESGNGLSFQPLTLLLQDGIYNIDQSSIVNIYQFNLTLTTYQPSNKVIFQSNSNAFENTTLLAITPIDINDNSNVTTFLTIENISFSNINNQSLVYIETVYSTVYISISNCNFSDINSIYTYYYPLIAVNTKRYPLKIYQDTFIVIDNCQFENIKQSSEHSKFPNCAINGANSNIKVSNVIVNTLFGNFISSQNGLVDVQTCSFNKVHSSGGVLSMQDSNLNIENSNFTNNSALDYGGGLTLYVESIIQSNVTIDNCSFINNDGANCGTILIQYSNSSTVSPQFNLISNSYFEENVATIGNGGAIFLSNSPLVIKNSTFLNNDASHGGGTFYVVLGTLELINSNVSQSSNATNGEILFTEGGSVTFNDVSFSQNINNNTNLFSCYYSIVNFIDCNNLNTASLCSNCSIADINSISNYCPSDSITTASATFSVSSSTTTTGGNNSSNSTYNIYSSILIVLIITITILINYPII